MAEKTPNDLFYDTLKDILFAERQIYKSLPDMTKAAQSEELKAAFLTHGAETEGQIKRLEAVFGRVNSARQNLRSHQGHS